MEDNSTQRRRRPLKISKYNPTPSPHCSIAVAPHLRHIIFPPGFKFPGVYVSKHDANTLYTKNLVPGQADDAVISVKDDDGSVVEYREWDPYSSKFAAAILSGAQNIWIEPGSRVLVIYSRDDEQFGITISHISDIVGPGGMVYVVDHRNSKTLANMADKRFNIVPIIHINNPRHYRMLINMVDVLFGAPNQAGETRAAYMNAMYFLKTGGHYVLFVQANCIESRSRGDTVFSSMLKPKEFEFKRMQHVTLKPFDIDHAYVFGAFRMIEMVDPSCLVTNKFWTAPSSHRADGERVTIYEQLKDLPVYMLFETSCGYALFQVHGMFKVERNYMAIEKFINPGDEVFKLIAYQPFESADDALVHLNAVCNETLYQQLIDFLVLHLPTPMEGGKHCYSLALFSGGMAHSILHNTKIASLADLFHVDIIRGVRMHIDKFIKDMKPGDLEKAQLDLARNYCRQKLISPDEGMSQKKRSGLQASIPSRKRPTRKWQADAKTNNWR
ncbi:Mediator of RNA polymerase II transcription subunit 36a-like protein [Heracleum sosnowskyi]|uniref:Mediator of RNA polymerase II transcription subunit 36a-like protein n=1 Tax=Heracleum sosnowskyi TaxID=360622 RepID=A0AAD8HES5_9APIA|nr:Mediator of RNA polymerase II transcription subunit 36a-like protein [Heracleum sosnowskyi]